MDDAGGGRRGPRPTLTAADLHVVGRAYGVSTATVRDLGGSGNLNLLVAGTRGPLVVRAYRRHVSPSRVADLQAARRRLVERGVPAAASVPTHAGDPYVEVGSSVGEAETFVPSDSTMRSLAELATALPMLARLHDSLRGVDLGAAARTVAFANYVAPADLVQATRVGTDRIRAWGPTEDELALAQGAERLAEAAGEANESFVDLPSQLTHGDFWDNNILFRGGEVVLVGDLDFMCDRLRIDDLALTLHFASYDLGRPTAPAAVAALAALVSAYDAGSDTPLSAAEKAALPVALARQPLWSIAVWAARLDDEDAARRHIRGHLAAVERGLGILRNIGQWREALQ